MFTFEMEMGIRIVMQKNCDKEVFIHLQNVHVQSAHAKKLIFVFV